MSVAQENSRLSGSNHRSVKGGIISIEKLMQLMLVQVWSFVGAKRKTSKTGTSQVGARLRIKNRENF